MGRRVARPPFPAFAKRGVTKITERDFRAGACAEKPHAENAKSNFGIYLLSCIALRRNGSVSKQSALQLICVYLTVSILGRRLPRAFREGASLDGEPVWQNGRESVRLPIEIRRPASGGINQIMPGPRLAKRPSPLLAITAAVMFQRNTATLISPMTRKLIRFG